MDSPTAVVGSSKAFFQNLSLVSSRVVFLKAFLLPPTCNGYGGNQKQEYCDQCEEFLRPHRFLACPAYAPPIIKYVRGCGGIVTHLSRAFTVLTVIDSESLVVFAFWSWKRTSFLELGLQVNMALTTKVGSIGWHFNTTRCQFMPQPNSDPLPDN